MESRLSNSTLTSVAVLEYRDPATLLKGLHEPEPSEAIPATAPAGLTELEVAERVARARTEAIVEAERTFHEALERERHQNLQRVEKTLEGFSAERVAYFKAVENELLQLALAIARKIIQRETQMDPTLLAGLVRIALDRMQSEGSVRVRVPSADADRWRTTLASNSQMQWSVEPDDALLPGDCIVETEVGSANFGFEAQLRSVEGSLLELMARRPEAA
jgi:flagellar assembly protein FliH